ncbi:MAG TPA: PEP-CTERM sorting domain-containing protein [Pirellulales bacterium]|nr:PEP-CTERM sorting domain-containing protein [Pirellulales bacterium]
MGISEDLSSLELGGPSGLHTTAAEWVYLRKHPFLEITNDPTSDGNLTSLTIQLNNLTQNLKNITSPSTGIDALPTSSPPSITSSTATVASSSTGSEVTLNFANLAPGASVIFRLELDPATAADNPFADYRQIFFTIGGTDTSQNAESSATFSTLNGNVTAGPKVWDNLPSALASQTSFGIAFSCLNSPDTVITVPAITDSNAPVPEPSSFVLTGFAALGLLIARKKFSRPGL